MVHKILYFLTILSISMQTFGQDQTEVMRYEFTMTYKPKVDNEELKQENVYLDLWDTSSRFATEQRVKYIEYLAQRRAIASSRTTIDLTGTPKPGLDLLVQKQDNSLYYFSKIGVSDFKTSEPLHSISWDITPEMSLYEGMEVQKATTNYKGRFWTVWFTQSISVIEGPYKFKNLPGFVVKAASEDGEYLFEFTKSHKAQTILTYNQYDKAMVIDDEKVKKLREVTANKSFNQVLAEKGIVISGGLDAEQEREMNVKMGDSNNYIEKL